MELSLFLYHQKSNAVYIEVTFHLFQFPSPFLPRIRGLLVDPRFSGDYSKTDYKLNLSLIVNIKMKLVFSVFLLNREAALS